MPCQIQVCNWQTYLYLQPHLHAPSRFPQGRKFIYIPYVFFFLFRVDIQSQVFTLHSRLNFMYTNYSSSTYPETIAVSSSAFLASPTTNQGLRNSRLISGVLKLFIVYQGKISAQPEIEVLRWRKTWVSDKARKRDHTIGLSIVWFF